MKNLCSKTLKTLINELSKPVGSAKAKDFSKKNLFVIQYTNIDKVKMFFVLYDMVFSTF